METNIKSLTVWNSSIFFENLQIQQFLNQLFANNGLCVNQSYLQRNFNGLYLYIDIVRWYSKKNRKTKKVISWLNKDLNSLYIAKKKNSNFNFLNNSEFLHKIRIFRRSAFPGQRYFYTKGYLTRKYGALENNLIQNIGLKVLPLLSLYSKTKIVGVHLKYQVLSLGKISRPIKKALGYYRKSPFFRPGLSLFRWIFQGKGHPIVLANFIKYQIQQNYKDKRRMRWFLSFLADVLKIYFGTNKCQIQGLRIEIRGRLQRKDRRNRLKRSFQQGSLPLQTLKLPISFYSTYAFTKNGLVNIKVWIYFANNNVSTKKNKISQIS
jgi:hypothetical protein